ncbi:MAG: hypothetical protein Q9M36_11565 [Sulfurovum sp.]|nr:hypothetical protein [Sulfurovum sp.]
MLYFFGGRAIETSIAEAKLVTANDAFITLQTTHDDAKALQILKESNPALFELYSYSQALKSQDIKTLETLSQSSNTIIADVSGYTVATLQKKPVESVLYNELVLLQEAYLAIKAGDNKQAKSKLEAIDERSALATITGFLKHSLIKAN